MKGTLLRQFVILLGLSHLICLIAAVPIARTESLMQGSQVHVPENINNLHKLISERNWHREEPTSAERMDLELNDYPPSGANGRHTPRSQYP